MFGITVKNLRDLYGHAVVQVACDGCGRAAVGEEATAAELCRLLGWEHDVDTGGVYCVRCLRKRHGTRRFVRRWQ